MYHGLRGSMGMLDHANPTRLSKRHQISPYSHEVTRSLHLTHILDVSRGFHRIQKDIVLLQGESNIQYYHIPNFELGTFGN